MGKLFSSVWCMMVECNNVINGMIISNIMVIKINCLFFCCRNVE